MPDALLVLNAGSSSLMFSVFLDGDPPQPLVRGQLDWTCSSIAFRLHL
jgi:acetate kinase